jgi:hypothetical protein
MLLFACLCLLDCTFTTSVDCSLTYSCRSYRISGVGQSVRAGDIREYIEGYILERGELPAGKHDLGSTEVYNLPVGIVDFDEIARGAKS